MVKKNSGWTLVADMGTIEYQEKGFTVEIVASPQGTEKAKIWEMYSDEANTWQYSARGITLPADPTLLDALADMLKKAAELLVKVNAKTSPPPFKGKGKNPSPQMVELTPEISSILSAALAAKHAETLPPASPPTKKGKRKA